MADDKTSAGGTVTHDITMEIKIGPQQESHIIKLHSYFILHPRHYCLSHTTTPKSILKPPRSKTSRKSKASKSLLNP